MCVSLKAEPAGKVQVIATTPPPSSNPSGKSAGSQLMLASAPGLIRTDLDEYWLLPVSWPVTAVHFTVRLAVAWFANQTESAKKFVGLLGAAWSTICSNSNAKVTKIEE